MKARPGKLNGLYLLDRASFDLIYGPEEQAEIAELVDIYAPPQTGASIQENKALLADAEVFFSGWGAPTFDEAFLDATPKLRAVFYGAGSIRYFMTDAFWKRDIVITSAYAANAVPVAEYTLSIILLSLKYFWRYISGVRQGCGWGDHTRPSTGNFQSTVGFVSCGMIARKTLELLSNYDLKRIVYCPFLTDEEARELNVERVSLRELFQRANVVSVHSPLLPETRGYITGELIGSMKRNATLINTSRGAVVREQELIEVLKARADLTAVLDVTDPEPPRPGSPLLTLPNAVVSPHIAGSMGSEIRRLGRYMVDELKRYLAGEPLKWQITNELAARMA